MLKNANLSGLSSDSSVDDNRNRSRTIDSELRKLESLFLALARRLTCLKWRTFSRNALTSARLLVAMPFREFVQAVGGLDRQFAIGRIGDVFFLHGRVDVDAVFQGRLALE